MNTNSSTSTHQKKGGDRFVSPAVLFEEMTYDDTSTEKREEQGEGDDGVCVEKRRWFSQRWQLGSNGSKECHLLGSATTLGIQNLGFVFVTRISRTAFCVLCVLSYVFDGLVVSRNFQDHPKMEGRMVADVGSDPLQQDITAIAMRLARCRHVGMMEMVARWVLKPVHHHWTSTILFSNNLDLIEINNLSRSEWL